MALYVVVLGKLKCNVKVFLWTGAVIGMSSLLLYQYEKKIVASLAKRRSMSGEATKHRSMVVQEPNVRKLEIR